MSKSSALQFSEALANYSADLSQRLRELDQVSSRISNGSSRHNTPIQFIWMDELEASRETITACLEQRNSSVPFHSLLDFAEACADNLERALDRSEAIAYKRFGFVPHVTAAAALTVPPSSEEKTVLQTPHHKDLNSSAYSSNTSGGGSSSDQHHTLATLTARGDNARPFAITPQRSDIACTSFMPFNFDDPPTPQMELSSATLSLLNKM